MYVKIALRFIAALLGFYLLSSLWPTWSDPWNQWKFLPRGISTFLCFYFATNGNLRPMFKWD
jgi:hypothetical protein